MNKAALGRILGPRGLMPSAKTGTVVKDVGASVTDMVGASEYRERLGVVRMAVGQLGMTPEELSKNIKSFVDHVKKDMAALSDRIAKDIHEVVSTIYLEAQASSLDSHLGIHLHSPFCFPLRADNSADIRNRCLAQQTVLV